MVWVFESPPQNGFFNYAVQTPPSQVFKNTFAGLWGTVVWVFGPSPQDTSNIFLASCKSNNTIIGIQKHLWWPIGYRGIAVWGATPEPEQIFGSVQFKHHHPRYPTTLSLANRVQWYGCLGRHPRSQAIFFGIVQFKHLHPRYSKTPLLA